MEERLREALAALVEQIELTRPKDSKGHDLRMNTAFVEAKVLLEALSRPRPN